jgi:hypothetical protein
MGSGFFVRSSTVRQRVPLIAQFLLILLIPIIRTLITSKRCQVIQRSRVEIYIIVVVYSLRQAKVSAPRFDFPRRTFDLG